MKRKTVEIQVICISLRAIFDKIREVTNWGDGFAEIQVSSYWMEDGLLQVYGDDPEAARIVTNTFDAIKRDFDRAWDLSHSSMEIQQ